MTEHERHDLETTYGRRVVTACFICLMVGFVIGLVIGLGSAAVLMYTPLGGSHVQNGN